MSIKKIFPLSAITAVLLAAAFGASAQGPTWNSSKIEAYNGYDYELWNQDNKGTVSMKLTGDNGQGANAKGGTFDAQWSNTCNVLFRSGKKWGPNSTQNHTAVGQITCDFAANWNSSDDVRYLGMYGWAYFVSGKVPTKRENGQSASFSNQIEWYIIQSRGSYNPTSGSDCKAYGSGTIDGIAYDFKVCDRIGQPMLTGNGNFKQFFSIPTGGGRTSGKVDVSAHFKAWHNAGMYMDGPLYEVAMKIESYKCNNNQAQGSGSGSVTKNILTIGGGSTGGDKYTLTVTASPTEGGSVSKNPDSSSYSSGRSVKLTATPKPGWKFDRWEGDTTGTRDTITVRMSKDKTVRAVFSQTGSTSGPFTLTVTASPTEGGSVSKNPDSSSYSSGRSVKLTATPKPGWKFDRWAGDTTGTRDTITVRMSKDKTVRAVFSQSSTIVPPEIFTLTVTASPTEGGSVSKNPDSSSYSSGRSVKLTATPKPGWKFDRWEGDTTGTRDTITVRVSRDKTVRAVFSQSSTIVPPEIFTLTVTASPPEGGSVSKNPDSSSYSSGRSVKLTATPEPGWKFDRWEGDTTGTRDTITVRVSRDKSVTAVFTEDSTNVGVSLRSPTAAGAKSGLRGTALQNSMVNVAFTASNSGEAALKLYNLKGNVISTVRLQTTAGRNYTHTFNTGKVPRGTYLVGLRSGGGAEQTARVLVK